MANIIDGKLIAASLRDECAQRVLALKEKGVSPRLDVIIVGDAAPAGPYGHGRTLSS